MRYNCFCRARVGHSPPPPPPKKKRKLTGANSVPEKLGPSVDARPALSTSCFRSEYWGFLEIAAEGGESMV